LTKEVGVSRRLRVHVPGGFYHVTLRGNHQQDIFRVDADRLLLNAIVARATERYGARLHAYCWMSNHLHLLLQVGEQPLAHVMRQIASGYARAFQQKIETTGHLFERRYHATLVDVDSYLMELLRYIHLNPVRARLVNHPAEYRWSSHHAYAGRTAPELWLTTSFALALFAEDRLRAHAAYRRFVELPQSAERDEWVLDLGGGMPQPSVKAANPGNGVVPATRQSLEALIAEGCKRFGVAEAHLASPSREACIVQARAWIAREALARRVATLSAVARALGRDRATLRFAMRQHFPAEP
jgi:REP element-mobilizing transposase RayT